MMILLLLVTLVFGSSDFDMSSLNFADESSPSLEMDFYSSDYISSFTTSVLVNRPTTSAAGFLFTTGYMYHISSSICCSSSLKTHFPESSIIDCSSIIETLSSTAEQQMSSLDSTEYSTPVPSVTPLMTPLMTPSFLSVINQYIVWIAIGIAGIVLLLCFSIICLICLICIRKKRRSRKYSVKVERLIQDEIDYQCAAPLIIEYNSNSEEREVIAAETTTFIIKYSESVEDHNSTVTKPEQTKEDDKQETDDDSLQEDSNQNTVVNTNELSDDEPHEKGLNQCNNNNDVSEDLNKESVNEPPHKEGESDGLNTAGEDGSKCNQENDTNDVTESQQKDTAELLVENDVFVNQESKEDQEIDGESEPTKRQLSSTVSIDDENEIKNDDNEQRKEPDTQQVSILLTSKTEIF